MLKAHFFWYESEESKKSPPRRFTTITPMNYDPGALTE